MAKKERLGARTTPIRTKAVKAIEIEEVREEKPPVRRRQRSTRLSSKRRATARRVKRVQGRHPKGTRAKIKTIVVDIEVKGAAQSVRGTFEGKDFRTQDSEIIWTWIHDPKTKKMAVQLNANGGWLWYTYSGVSNQENADFESAPSKGQYYNRVIKKHPFVKGKGV